MSNRRVKELRQQFRFKSGTRISGVSPDLAAAALQEIYEEHGALHPATVVDESREEAAPLHPVFEWDDPVAAEQYRLHQARNLIRAVEVAPRKDGGESAQVWVHVHSGTASAYHPVAVVVDRPDMYAAAMHELSQYMASAIKSVEQLKTTAEQQGADPDRMARIAIASQAMATAKVAVAAIN